MAKKRDDKKIDTEGNKKEFDKIKEILGQDIEEEKERIDIIDKIDRISNQNFYRKNKLDTETSLALLSQLVDEEDPFIKQKIKEYEGVGKEKKDFLKDVSQHIDNNVLHSIMSEESSRIDEYNTYYLIKSMIPQIGQGIEAFIDNIVSPDDFTKLDVDIDYKASVEPSDLYTLREKRKELSETYKLREKIETALDNALSLGDHFIIVYNFKDKIQDFITNENYSAMNNINKFIINENHIPKNDPDFKRLLTIINEESRSDKDDDKVNKYTTNDLTGFISESLSEFAPINNDEEVFPSLETLLLEETQGKNSKGANALNIIGSNTHMDIPSEYSRVKKKSKNKKIKLDKNLAINKSIIVTPKPENVVKLYYNNAVFGYYYFEETSDKLINERRRSKDPSFAGKVSANNALYGALNKEGKYFSEKSKLIQKIFSKTISNRLDNKFIQDNPKIAEEIYALMKLKHDSNSPGYINFASKEQVVHFKPNSSEGYGKSILSKVTFFSKLYIGILINTFMRSIVRKNEKNVFYVDIGIDKDARESVSRVIRDIKQKEFRFSNFKDITSVIRRVGDLQDYFIPTVDGEKPIEIETMDTGNPPELDSPFVEFLKKSIVGGLGVPAAYVGYAEEVAFARSLSMENGRFLRKTIRYQATFQEDITKLYRILFANDYPELFIEDENNKNRSFSHVFDLAAIYAVLPSPATLNLTNTSELLNQATSIIDTVSMVMSEAEDEEIPKLDAKLKKEMYKRLVPTLDWEYYEEIISKIRDKTKVDKQELDINEEEGDESDLE